MMKKYRLSVSMVGSALALLAIGITARWTPAQNSNDPPASSTGRIRQLLAVGDPIRGQNNSFGLGFFRQNSTLAPGGAYVLHSVTDDGTLYLSDQGGVSLIRLRSKPGRTAA